MMVLPHRKLGGRRRSNRHVGQQAPKPYSTRTSKSKIGSPAVEGVRSKSKQQRKRIKVACEHCRKRKKRCEPLDASNPFEPDPNTCVQCTMHSEECSRGQNLRVGSVPLWFYQGIDLLSLPNESPQPFPEQYGHFDPFSQQDDPILTQPQSLPEPSSSPSSQAPLEVDALLGYSEQRGWSLPEKEQSEREPYVHGTTTVKQEQTKIEIETIGLGIHIPDAQPQHPDVVEYLPSPLPASRYDPHAIFRVANQPLDHSQEQADYVHQASKLPMGGQTEIPSLEWQTTADLFLQRPHVGPLHEINDFDRLIHSSFHDGGSSQDIHQTTYEEPQWSDHADMSSLSSATSDDS